MDRSTHTLILVALLWASNAFGAFTYYRSVTIDSSKCGGSDSLNFPVLFNTTDASLKTIGNGGHVANSNGYDIRWYSDSGLTTPLNYELERYNASTGECVFWVKVPTVSHSSNTIIYMAYGDSGLSSDGSSSSTWDSNYKAVYHLKDGTTLSLTDATGGNDGTGSGTPTAVAGQMDGAMHLVRATHQNFSIANATDIPVDTAWTVSMWTNIAGGYAGGDDFAAMWGGSANNGPHIGYKDNGFTQPQFFVAIWGGDEAKDPSVATTGWKYICATWDGTSIKMYVGGSLVATTASTIAAAVGYSANVGTDNLGGGNDYDGDLDEVRFSATARSADWITTEYNNQNSPSTFYTLGSENPISPPGSTTSTISGSGTTVISGSGTTTISP